MKWINVNECLPENGEYVLTYSYDNIPQIQLGFYSTFLICG